MKYISNNRGITFIEIMVTLVIFTLGIVGIFRSFSAAITQIGHLRNRMYANNLLENRIASIERKLRIYNTLPFELNYDETVDVGGKEVTFVQRMDIREVEDYADVFQLDLAFLWKERAKDIRLARTAYLLDFYYFEEDQ